MKTNARVVPLPLVVDLAGALLISILITTSGPPQLVSADSKTRFPAPHGIRSGSYDDGNSFSEERRHLAQPIVLNRILRESNDFKVTTAPGSSSAGNELIMVLPHESHKRELASNPVSDKKTVLRTGSGSDARISSNQDVTTLALAVDNSTSVAITNINSSWNNVFVNIANPALAAFPSAQPD